MLRQILLPTILLILGYGFWISPDFKEIAAGVAIFLFGMLSLEEGFKAFSSGGLEKVLRKSTDKLYKSIGFGILSTTIMQSSSLVSILTISFLSAGLIGLAQGIGIIFGANIGTTTGAWLVAGFGLKVNIAAYAMPMLVFGVILIFQNSKSLKGMGYILSGLGFLFLGIHYMKDGFEAFKSTIDLASFSIDGLKGLLLYTAIGIFATVVMQSSHATLVLIITALSVGQISYENALALAIGGNVGTTITAIIGSMSSNIDGKRLAGAHLIFNVVTGLVAIIFMNQIMFGVDFISGIFGIAQDDYALKLAVFHTIFNILGVIIMVPFVNKLVTFLQNTLKVKLDSKDVIDRAIHLNDSVLHLPSTALAAVIKETQHLYQNAFTIIAHGINVQERNILSSKSYDEVIADRYSKDTFDVNHYYNKKIKALYGEILDFSSKAQSSMSPEQINNLYKIKLANRDIVEAVKDTKHLQKNLFLYLKSENESIKEQYKLIQKNITEILRGIHEITLMQDEEDRIVKISKLKLISEKYDILSSGMLDELIRKKLITNEMATSLMNDSTYAYDISKNLIAMSEIIYVDGQSELDLLSDALNIDNDIEEILQKEHHEN